MNSLTGWAGRRVVGVFPHPDDEAWAAGGLLARAAAVGADVRLVSVTAGEAGTNRGGADGPIRDVRAAELRASAAALGAVAVDVFELPDGGLAQVDEDVARRVVVDRIIDPMKPHVIVALGDDGGYGHRDHVALTRWLRAWVPPSIALWLAAFAPGLFDGVRAGLMRRRPELCDEVALGVVEPDVEIVLSEVERRRKLAAIAAHRSQLPGGDALRFLGPGIVPRLLEREGWVIVP